MEYHQRLERRLQVHVVWVILCVVVCSPCEALVPGVEVHPGAPQEQPDHLVAVVHGRRHEGRVALGCNSIDILDGLNSSLNPSLNHPFLYLVPS